MRFFNPWRAKKHKAPEQYEFIAELEPDNPMFIIGDIHGCIDLLDLLLTAAPKDAQLIFVGDLVDRGEDSALVLTRVRDLCNQGAICLMGNHEQMLLDFLEQPTKYGPRWLYNGGLQTLQSYGVRSVAYSGVIRPPIPIVSGHPYRFNPAGDSGVSGHPVFA